jgi:hypothetical protein
MRVTNKIFIAFQEEKVTQQPAPRCIKALKTGDTCYPLFSDTTCHDCATKWKENRESG